MLQIGDLQQVVQHFCGKLLGGGAKPYTLDPFTYTINFASLGASATASANFLVQNDSAFVITQTTYLITDTSDVAVAELQPFGSGLTTGLVGVLVTLSDTGSGRNLMDAGVPIDGLFGTAQRPYVWPYPKILDPSSTFSTQLQNLVATARRVRLAFHGYKVFGQWRRYKDSR